jgi:hypothetical protein
MTRSVAVIAAAAVLQQLFAVAFGKDEGVEISFGPYVSSWANLILLYAKMARLAEGKSTLHK